MNHNFPQAKKKTKTLGLLHSSYLPQILEGYTIISENLSRKSYQIESVEMRFGGDYELSLRDLADLKREREEKESERAAIPIFHVILIEQCSTGKPEICFAVRFEFVYDFCFLNLSSKCIHFIK